MKTLTKSALYALLATTLLSACSRPYATFQKTTPERFYAKKATVAPIIETATVTPAPVTEVPTTTEATQAPVVAPAPIVAAQSQLNEVLAANKTGLATNKKLAKRMNQIQTLLASPSEKQSLNAATTTKTSAMAKIVTKKINKQIEKKLAPKAAQTQSAIRLGIILGLAGLLLLIIGNGFFATLGGIALVIGLVGILLGYLDIL